MNNDNMNEVESEVELYNQKKDNLCKLGNFTYLVDCAIKDYENSKRFLFRIQNLKQQYNLNYQIICDLEKTDESKMRKGDLIFLKELAKDVKLEYEICYDILNALEVSLVESKEPEYPTFVPKMREAIKNGDYKLIKQLQIHNSDYMKKFQPLLRNNNFIDKEKKDLQKCYNEFIEFEFSQLSKLYNIFSSLKSLVDLSSVNSSLSLKSLSKLYDSSVNLENILSKVPENFQNSVLQKYIANCNESIKDNPYGFDALEENINRNFPIKQENIKNLYNEFFLPIVTKAVTGFLDETNKNVQGIENFLAHELNKAEDFIRQEVSNLKQNVNLAALDGNNGNNNGRLSPTHKADNTQSKKFSDPKDLRVGSRAGSGAGSGISK